MTGSVDAPQVSVFGYGMWTAAGPDGPSSVSAMRAGVAGSSKANLWDMTSGENLNAFRVHAHQWWEGASFLPRLIAPTISEVLDQLPALKGAEDIDPETIPILINIAPPDRPGLAENADRLVLDGLATELGRPMPKGSSIISMGRIGVPHLIARATERLKTHPLCILVCAESLLRQQLVAHYTEKGRLLCGDNSSGFIPGEASVALLVGRTGAYSAPQLAILGMGGGSEPSGDGGTKDAPVTAKGLTAAMRAALTVSGTEFYDIPMVMGDLNGEHFKFKELSYAVMRLDRIPPEERTRRPREHIEHWNVVETIGEVGAALMPAAIGWACQAGQSEFLPGERVLFFAGEDDGQRVAIVGEWRDG